MANRVIKMVGTRSREPTVRSATSDVDSGDDDGETPHAINEVSTLPDQRHSKMFGVLLASCTCRCVT